jgi:toluene monooxygenase electron transfer component
MLAEGEVEVLWLDAPGLTKRDHDRGVKLACQCQPRSDCIVKALIAEEFVPRIRPRRFVARFAEARDITYDMREFKFNGPEEARFLAGQYSLFHLEGVAGLRAYSMSNIVNSEGSWSFVIRRVPNGAATGVLFDRLKPGDEIMIDGPYGLAFLRADSPRNIVCIAGGAGLSPMLSIARGMARERALDDRRLYFFFGGRESRDICGQPILDAIPELRSRIFYHASTSVPESNADNQWRGASGLVHELVARKLAGDFKGYEYYLAGPPPMIQAVLKLLMFDHKVPREQIHYDRFF